VQDAAMNNAAAEPATETVPAFSPPLPPATATAPVRLVCLDAYRGLIMLTLLFGGVFQSLRNTPGWEWLALHNDHVAWEGCVYWDLIQPSFMFMVGVAMPFALAKRAAAGADWGQRFARVLIRALNLMLVGIVLDHFGSDKIQIGFIRVLQQIAIGYVLAFFVAEKSWRVQAITAGVILIGYNLLWMFNPWNGPGGPWAKGNENIGSVFDWWMLERHYSGYYVGLNAIPSTATIIFGVMAGSLIQKRLPHGHTLLILTGCGLAALALGWAVSPWLPLIKRIWTPSWTVYAAGATTLMLAAFYLVIEVWGLRRWAFPLVVVGMNSIAAYCLPGLFGNWWSRLTGAWVKFIGDNWIRFAPDSVWRPVFEKFLFVAFAWLVLYWLYRRRIFLKC
jgi:heparan-alpha-glucosaminide N-acetyltransferase